MKIFKFVIIYNLFITCIVTFAMQEPLLQPKSAKAIITTSINPTQTKDGYESFSDLREAKEEIKQEQQSNVRPSKLKTMAIAPQKVQISQEEDQREWDVMMDTHLALYLDSNQGNILSKEDRDSLQKIKTESSTKQRKEFCNATLKSKCSMTTFCLLTACIPLMMVGHYTLGWGDQDSSSTPCPAPTSNCTTATHPLMPQETSKSLPDFYPIVYPIPHRTKNQFYSRRVYQAMQAEKLAQLHSSNATHLTKQNNPKVQSLKHFKRHTR